ncbi:DNA cytosine methyltransferase [Chitinophaga rhizophila]|uniref:Cytosine-specific methyltransferase n=1 Tax=Chitinophaga rhizophila TaxID=2866212 RepID=A0ABS7GBI5_9BACT|nr:DNA cytosine methyltransferase [Chitinophaga rhizophila]MBW8684691.1 DNA cytosine methyltransferase [Chitinophaga rhizophila]
MNGFKYIDLFAGAGGLSEGFIRAGFEPIAHVEMDAAACFTLRTRAAYHHLRSINKHDDYIAYLKGEITRNTLYDIIPSSILESIINLPIGPEFNDEIQNQIEKKIEKGHVDLIIGGPPCQAYSLVGRARSKTGMKGDPRNYLYIHYASFLERFKPTIFVFENVIGLKSAGGGIYLRNMEKLFLEKGYNMKLFTVEANNFGVLQNRRRIIIIGWKSDFPVIIPDIEEIKKSSNYKVINILADLPKIYAGESSNKYLKYNSRTNEYLKQSHIRNGINVLTQHIARPHTKQDKEIYRIAVNKWNGSKQRLNYNDLPERLKTHQNRESFSDRFKVVAADQPYSQTVVAHIAKDGHYYIHPDIDQNRSISIREAARLQSFPDDYYFEGVKETANRTPAFKQIGNAVPPLMAYEIALIIKKILCQLS